VKKIENKKEWNHHDLALNPIVFVSDENVLHAK